MALATLTKNGRAAIALAISSRPLHLAWGSGSPEWDADDPVLPSLVDSTALVNELGRRTPSRIGFVEPEAYAYSDASNAVIREMGLFMDTEFVDGLPEGQRYFVPAELRSPGLLLAAQIIIPRINRSPSVRQTVEFVLPI